MIDENKIKQEVVDNLMWDDRIMADEISVDWHDKTLKLSGTVGNILSKRMAEKKAYQVAGVELVENNLSVDNRASNRPADEDLKETIERNLYWNDYLNYSDLQVVIKNGVVSLKGTVDAFWKKQLSTEIAENVKGTLEVISEVQVAKNNNSDDEAIAEAVKAGLNGNANIDAQDIEVTVVSGYVILKGKVKSRDQNMQAYESALYTKGVTGIDNQLIIKNDMQNDFG